MLPTVLYHGSAFWTGKLKPGFQHTGVEVKWDETESNHYLYATTEREMAITLGWASAIEKRYGLDHFQTIGNSILIDVPKDVRPKPKKEELLELEVWLYKIVPAPKEDWELNKNPHNNLKSEYRTQRTITPKSLEKINLKEWIGQRVVMI